MHLLKNPEATSTCALKLQVSPSARVAWSRILHHHAQRLGRQVSILLPSYIGQNAKEGSGVFDPVRETKSQFGFYQFDQNLLPDENEIITKVESGEFDLLLIIHYFGFVKVNLSRIKTACEKSGVILVEDCAHSMFQHDVHIGSIGDFSFYSLHKIFATQTGGLLRINHCNDSPDQNKASDSGELCDVLVQLVSSNTSKIARKRVDNFRYLENALQRIEGVKQMWKLDDSTVPQSFPLLVPDGKREKLYFFLMEKGFPTVALYYRLADEIDRNEYSQSYDIADQILNLPVHQDTEIESLKALVKEIECFYE